MSPHGINSLVGDLVEMAKATERLPILERENERLHDDVESYAKQVQDREMAIISYKQEIDDLHAKVRSLEVERDDASFRVLEAEDTAAFALSKAQATRATLDVIIAKLDPPKPEPVKEPEPILPSAQDTFHKLQDQSVVDPTTVAAAPVTENGSVSGTATQSENASTSTTIPEAIHSISELPGQSESSPTPSTNPTANTGETQETVGQSLAKSMDVGLTTAETSSAESTHGPYFGKHYVNHPYYISLQDWIDGEGTEEGYYIGRYL